MLPYIELFGRQVPMYSVMTLVGVCLGLLYFKLCEKKRDFPPADAELALIYCFIGTFAGAKLLYLLTVLPEFLSDFKYLFSQTEPFLQKYLYSGLVFYGGLYGAVLSGWIYCRVCKQNFFELSRSLLPMLPLIHAFGRLGCFSMGCCYGCVSAEFGIAFQNSPFAPNGIPLLPVQLIEAVFELLLFAVLAIMARRRHSGKNMLCLWLIVYGIFRFVLEFFRGDAARGFIGFLSTSQVLSIVSIALGLAVYFRPRKKQAQS